MAIYFVVLKMSAKNERSLPRPLLNSKFYARVGHMYYVHVLLKGILMHKEFPTVCLNNSTHTQSSYMIVVPSVNNFAG